MEKKLLKYGDQRVPQELKTLRKKAFDCIELETQFEKAETEEGTDPKISTLSILRNF